MTYRVVFAPEAWDHLASQYTYILPLAGADTAKSYISEIIDYCEQMADFPQRGTTRDDIAPGLRIVGYRRRVAIAFHIDGSMVVIDGIFFGGRDYTGRLKP